MSEMMKNPRIMRKAQAERCKINGRICPGMAFGLANVEMPLTQFLYHFDWKLPGGMNQKKLDLTEAFAGKRSKTNNSASNLPLGPRKLPLIGNLDQLAGSLPHHALQDLANKHGPLMSPQFGEIPTFIISSPEIAKEVMKTHDLIFATRPQILATKIMTYGFTNIAFAPYEEESSNFIKWIASKAGSPINLTQKIYSSAYTVTSRAAFGNKTKDQESYISIMEETVKAAAGFNIADFYPSAEWLHLISGIKSKIEKLQKEADRILGNIINEHIAGKTTETESITILKFSIRPLDIFGAGSETSAMTVDCHV
ncbi:unnamed protein product [Camellia sinensis]